VTVDLGLDPTEDFVPDIAGIHNSFSGFASGLARKTGPEQDPAGEKRLQIVIGGLSPPKSVVKQGFLAYGRQVFLHFPQVFPQVLKTLGGDQIPCCTMASRRSLRL